MCRKNKKHWRIPLEIRWTYKGKTINDHNDLLPECSSIVYCIYYESGRKYIGKLVVRSMRRLKPTKAQLAIRKNFKRVELKDIPFADYVGSSKETVGEIIQSKEILYQCSTKKAATYIEAGILFNENAIFSDEYLNLNIIGKFYDNDLNGLLDPDVEVCEKSLNLELEHLRSEVRRLSFLEHTDTTGQ